MATNAAGSKDKQPAAAPAPPPAALMPADAPADGEKSKNHDKNEAKRLEKLAKFQAKQAKLAAEKQAAAAKPEAEKKKKKEEPKEAAVAVPEVAFVNTTPKGDKKDLSAPFPPTYQPKVVEAAWYDWWEKSGFFRPEFKADGSALDAGTYVVPIPPPNVTGALHLGHALTNAIQDTLVRWNRMQGKTVVWKKLMRERGITRHDLGREKFIDEVYAWKDEYVGRIYDQLRRIGSSFDWERSKFTMDPDLCESVKEAFVRLHDDGTIYRANRLVNWCTKLKTAVSNLEVEDTALEGRTMMSVPDHDPSKTYEFGVLISFAYQVENSDERIVVATTRLETMLGDTAIAVHPSDKRYQHLHGKFVIHPFQNRRIPIVADEYPDPEFGTGAVKITPAHDFNDFEVGRRNNLEFINIFTDDGKVNENGAPFTGLQRFDARVAVLEALKEKGLYVGTADNKMMLPICARSGNIVEPLLKPQWWVNCKGMAAQALEADWCISRQLWWGHRVPAYFVVIAGDANDRADSDRWVSGRTDAEALERAHTKFPKIDKASISLEQDDDVLDTWFSSGLWPFSIMGWPNQTLDMDRLFPNTLLETGWDILFFWVARMIMLSLKLTGKVPFTQVYCHALIRDAHGRKMSKSLGNVIDPYDIMEGITLERLLKRLETGNLDPRELVRASEAQRKDYPNGIPECGTDALRFGLLAYISGGRTILFDIQRVDGYRKFCNKIWNATRFALMKLGDDYKPRSSATPTGKESLADKWILAKLNKAIKETNASMEQFNFMHATSTIYQFWLYDLCDVYLEVCKGAIDNAASPEAKATAQDVLYTCLDQGLRLLHPMMPFVTEELFQRIPRRAGDNTVTIMKAAYPVFRSDWEFTAAEADFEVVNAVAAGARSLLTEYNIRSNASVYVEVASDAHRELIASQSAIIRGLTRGIKTLETVAHGAAAPSGCALQTISSAATVHLLVRGQLDIDVEIAKLHTKLGKVQALSAALEKVMAGDGYAARVKAEVKEADAAKLKGYATEIETLTASIANFEKLKA
ncbi:hypothetical protein BC831DRAFT_453206 [Entophlyctis helioformis]|nr:hypothetical protein BC831DRAFT_453206 [Entophlyctis helioformis]